MLKEVDRLGKMIATLEAAALKQEDSIECFQLKEDVEHYKRQWEGRGEHIDSLEAEVKEKDEQIAALERELDRARRGR